MLPKKYALNFFPTDLSGASRLPLTRLLVCFLSHLLYLLFLLFSPHCSSLHFSPLSLIPSVFQYSSVTWGFCLSTSLSLAPVGTMWQGEMGWGRVTQVNRLKSAGEAWGFIWCVRVCIRVGSRVGTSAQSYVSEVTPSVALIFPSVCCHFLSCPHQPSNSFCLRQKPLYIFAFIFIFLRFSFPCFPPTDLCLLYKIPLSKPLSLTIPLSLCSVWLFFHSTSLFYHTFLPHFLYTSPPWLCVTPAHLVLLPPPIRLHLSFLQARHPLMLVISLSSFSF